MVVGLHEGVDGLQIRGKFQRTLFQDLGPLSPGCSWGSGYWVQWAWKKGCQGVGSLGHFPRPEPPEKAER